MPCKRIILLIDEDQWLETALSMKNQQLRTLLESSDLNLYTGTGVHAIALGKEVLNVPPSYGGDACRQVDIEVYDLDCHLSLHNGKLPKSRFMLGEQEAFEFQCYYALHAQTGKRVGFSDVPVEHSSQFISLPPHDSGLNLEQKLDI